MPLELNLSNKVVKNLRKFGNTHSVIKIESGGTMKGIPDLNYFFSTDKAGWIELKCLEHMPVTKTALKNYTKEQRIFAKRRGRVGEKVFFLLQVGIDYFLFVGSDVPDWVSKQDMLKISVGHWVGSIDFDELYELL
jgi:hypothetical protein